MSHNGPHLSQKPIPKFLQLLTPPQFQLYLLQHIHILNQLHQMLVLLHQPVGYPLVSRLA